ncbi:MAG: hypothetical protein V4484_23590 [Pseudomonadota bacterium]
MNLVKNMEAVFVAIVILAGITTYATAKVTTGPVAAKEKVSTVVVTGKRLTPAQKAALDA